MAISAKKTSAKKASAKKAPGKKTRARKTGAKKVATKPAAEKQPLATATHPLLGLRNEIDQLFERFTEGWPHLKPMWRGFEGMDAFAGWPAWWGSGAAPQVDVRETASSYEISAELPGMEEKDIEVELSDNLLTIKGEKKEEREEKGESDYHLTERRYGAFRRSFTVPAGVDATKVDAKFSKGVLSIVLPKTKEALAARKVTVKPG